MCGSGGFVLSFFQFIVFVVKIALFLRVALGLCSCFQQCSLLPFLVRHENVDVTQHLFIDRLVPQNAELHCIALLLRASSVFHVAGSTWCFVPGN